MPPKPKKITKDTEVTRNIRELRQSRDENQTQFAIALGLKSPSQLSKWESGKNDPNPDGFARLATLADGEAKRFFLAKAGIPFNEKGEVDFGIESRGPALPERATIAFHQPIQTRKLPQEMQPQWDPELLIFCVEWLDAELERQRKRLPLKDYARLLVKVYEAGARSLRDVKAMSREVRIA